MCVCFGDVLKLNFQTEIKLMTCRVGCEVILMRLQEVLDVFYLRASN